MINFKFFQGNVLKRRFYTWISFWCPVRELYRWMREEKMSFFKEFKEKKCNQGVFHNFPTIALECYYVIKITMLQWRQFSRVIHQVKLCYFQG